MQSANRIFLSNLAFLVFMNLIVKPFWIFGVDRSVQNTVGQEAYGVYFGLFNLAYLAHVILDFGINNFNNRAVAQEHTIIKSYFPNLMTLKFLLALLYMGICLSVAWWREYDSFQINLLLFLALNQVLLSFILYFRSNLAGLHLFKQDSIVSVTDKLLMIFIVGSLLWGSLVDDFNILYFVYAQTVAFALTFLFSGFLVLRKIGGIQLDWQPKMWLNLLKQSYPFALITLLMSIYFRVDGVMLKELLTNGDQQAGIYAAGFRILDAVSMIGFLFGTLLLPMFSRLIAQKEKIAPLFKLSTAGLYVLATATAAIGWFYRLELMSWLYHEATPYYGEVFGYLILSFIFASSVYIFGALLASNNNMRLLNSVAFLSVLLNIGLNLSLIYTYGALGAAQATLATQMFVSIIQFFCILQIFKIPFHWGTFAKVIVFTTSAFGIAYFSQSIPIDWRFNAVLGGGIIVLLSFLLGLLQWRGLLDMVRSKINK